MNLVKKEYIFNLFVGFLSVFAILAVFLYKSNAGSKDDIYNTYLANFDNVSGVKLEDKIYLAGVEIGSVVSIYLRENGRASISFKAKKGIEIPEDSMMFIKSDGFEGSFIGLMLGIDDYALSQGDTIYNTTSALGINGMIDLVIKTLSYKSESSAS